MERNVIPSMWSVLVLFLIGRLISIISLPLEGLRGYGDFIHFYQLARLGWPFLEFWVEFPPIFPFLSAIIYQLSGGREHVYDYLLVVVLTIAQAGTLTLFYQLLTRMAGDNGQQTRLWFYMIVLLSLPYGWWYFDSLAVFAMLLGLWWLFEKKDLQSGIAFGIGALIKWFPALAIAGVWRFRPPRRAIVSTGLVLGLVALVLSGLLIASPDYTLASLRSQASKGSWETLWALWDGNLSTGNFGPESERFDPETALKLLGNPPKVSPWLSLIPFVLVGLWFFMRSPMLNERQIIAFVGLTWCIYLLWSPGWSPQWVLYLLPLILLSLPVREAILMAITLTTVNLLEWPVLLSRGYFWGLWLTVPLRTVLWVLLMVAFWRVIKLSPPSDQLPNLVGEIG